MIGMAMAIAGLCKTSRSAVENRDPELGNDKSRKRLLPANDAKDAKNHGCVANLFFVSFASFADRCFSLCRVKIVNSRTAGLSESRIPVIRS